MSPFDVILFDVGGVLLTNGWDHVQRAAVLEQFHLDKAAFESRHAKPNDAWERGMITAREYLDATVFYEPRNFTHEDFLEALFAQSVLLPNGALPVLQDLSAGGKWVLGTLNNEAREPNEYRFQRFGLRAYFDVAFSSCFIGLRKPEPAMYKRALDVLGKPAERVLFIDDRAENVEAAQASGMSGLRFQGEDRLRQDLGALGVL
jgi:putative hydrolase of the HAD superfamily